MRTLKELFNQWRNRDIHNGRAFITDGPIDPILWESANPRILFVAKEAYGEVGAKEGWDLPTIVREEWGGPKYKFWWSVGYWAVALRFTSIQSFAEFPEYTENYALARDAVMNAAILNLKKSGGLSSSNDDDLRRYVAADGDFIKEQFDILNPDIVVFCNTWHLVKELWPDAEAVSQYVLYWAKEGKLFINYWHPACHYPNSVMFYALCAIYRNALEANHRLHGRSAE